MDLSWNKIRRLLKDTKELQQIGSANIIAKVIMGIFWFYIAATLGTEDYGQVSYLIALGSMGAALSMVGSSNSLIVYGAKKIPIESAIYSISLIIGTITSIVFYFLFENIIICIFIFGYIVFNLGLAELLGKKEYKNYSIIFVIQKIVFVGLGLLFYHFIGFEGIVLGFGLSLFVVIYVIIKGFRETKIDFKILKPRFGFMINNYALSIERILGGQVDKLLIAPMFGFGLLGNFALSLQFFSIMSIIPNIVFQYTLSQDAIGRSNLKIKKISVISSIIVAVLGIILSPIVIPIIFPKYVEAVQLIQIVSIHVIANAVIFAYNSKFLGKENSKYVLIGKAISVGIYLIGIFTLGTLLGINGVAIALVLSGIGQAIFNIVASRYLKNSEEENGEKNE
jgi:O-antigen/teichoic acid export membrane protein